LNAVQDGGAGAQPADGFGRPRQSRARAWAIEGLVALVLIALLLGPPFIYAGGWPPVVTIESESMQHGAPGVGPLDVGDLVIIKRLSSVSEVVTYAEGRAIGHSTFGEFGDVVLYNRETGGTPIIHRALLWLDFDETTQTWNAPELKGLRNGPDWSRGDGGSSPTLIPRSTTLLLHGMQTARGSVEIELQHLEERDGFISRGDNNPVVDQRRGSGISADKTVRAEQIVGVARGELPCVGVLTLAIIGRTSRVTGDHTTCAVLIVIVIVIIGWVGHALVTRGIRYGLARRAKRLAGSAPPPAAPSPAFPGPSPALVSLPEEPPPGRRVTGAGAVAMRRAAARRAAERRRTRR
jgi:signal peptidase